MLEVFMTYDLTAYLNSKYSDEAVYLYRNTLPFCCTHSMNSVDAVREAPEYILCRLTRVFTTFCYVIRTPIFIAVNPVKGWIKINPSNKKNKKKTRCIFY